MQRRASTTSKSYSDEAELLAIFGHRSTSETSAGASSPRVTIQGSNQPSNPFVAESTSRRPSSNNMSHEISSNQSLQSDNARSLQQYTSSSDEASSEEGSSGGDWWELGDSEDEEVLSEDCRSAGEGVVENSDRRRSDDGVTSRGLRNRHRSSARGGLHVSHVHLALGVSRRNSASHNRRRHRRKRYVESLQRSNVDLRDENSRLREFLEYLERSVPKESG